jgi:hypothetical protein
MVFRVLSLGAGVQSSALLLMSEAGELPRLDAAVFADTQWEPAEVYEHLDRLTAAVTIPVHRVTNGSLRADFMAGAVGVEADRFTRIPVFIRDAAGRPGMGRRDCTRDYKIRPIRREVRRLMTEAGASTVEQWVGISLDEIGRMKPSGVQYVTNVYPLVEHRLTRWDCRLWLDRHGWQAPRSACIACPYHSDAEWRRIKADAAAWADAVETDQAIRHAKAMKGTSYLHSSLTPLADVDLSTAEDHGQLNLFEQECEGMCGV